MSCRKQGHRSHVVLHVYIHTHVVNGHAWDMKKTANRLTMATARGRWPEEEQNNPRKMWALSSRKLIQRVKYHYRRSVFISYTACVHIKYVIGLRAKMPIFVTFQSLPLTEKMQFCCYTKNEESSFVWTIRGKKRMQRKYRPNMWISSSYTDYWRIKNQIHCTSRMLSKPL